MPVNHFAVKLGKHPARPGPPKFPMSKYLDSDVLPAPPVAYSNSRGITSFGMFCNDVLGCCVISSKFHDLQAYIMSVIAQTVGQDLIHADMFDDQDIISYYSKWGGYVQGNPETDNGMEILTAIENWESEGLMGHKLLGHVNPDPKNRLHIQQGVYLFGGVDVGLQLPQCWQGQKVWDAKPNIDSPGSWGAHDVSILDYDSNIGQYLTCTWGELQILTEDGLAWACDEAHALIQEEFNPPAGFDLTGLLAAKGQVSA